MVSTSLLETVQALSVQEKLSLIHSITEMLQNDVSPNNGTAAQNGSSSNQPRAPKELNTNKEGYTLEQQKIRAKIQELLDRPNPTPEQMLPGGIWKGKVEFTEEDFKAAEWRPTDEELEGV